MRTARSPFLRIAMLVICWLMGAELWCGVIPMFSQPCEEPAVCTDDDKDRKSE